MTTRGLFVTGTDTGVGKTWISRMLIDSAPGTMVATYVKPVQTGCTRSKDGILKAPDFEYVAEGAMMPTAKYHDHVPYRYHRACSPHLAACLEKKPIRLKRILEGYYIVSARADLTVVEGAGGLMSPLSATETMLDLMIKLRLPLVVVTRPALGTLSQTALTLDRIRAAGLVLAGVVINHTEESAEDYIMRENKRCIADLARGAPVAAVRYGQTGGPAFERFFRAIIA